MLSIVNSCNLIGIDGFIVNVEVDITRGMPCFNIVGLASIEIKEAKERVKSAIINSDFEFPTKRIVVNLSPADIKKEGSLLDLPISIGLLINYIKRETNLAIGETTAEQIKMEIGCAMPLMTKMSMEVRGRDLSNGLPRNIIITSSQIEEAMQESIKKIVEVIKITLEKTPPELASDIMEKGIYLAGGGALIKNLDKLVNKETGMPVYIAEEPLECVVRGTGKTVEDLERLKSVLINARKRR